MMNYLQADIIIIIPESVMLKCCMFGIHYIWKVLTHLRKVKPIP